MKVEIIKGDITQLEIDIIVNAANSSLLGGGGVDGAIHKAGGPAILDDCRRIRNRIGCCPVGEAVDTTAGLLKAKRVIHTVGPRWNQGKSGEAEKLYNCYINTLQLADKLQMKSIAFPNISTGIYGYPKEEAAQIAYKAWQDYVPNSIEHLIFVCFDDENFSIYQKLAFN